ncbi:hypothetical protein D3C80_1513380 [compost metagenome]
MQGLQKEVANLVARVTSHPIGVPANKIASSPSVIVGEGVLSKARRMAIGTTVFVGEDDDPQNRNFSG